MSHPPCEDVSWKSNIARGSSDYLVILLVRMWVENTPPINVMIPTLRHPPCEDVSWKDNIADIDGGWFGHPPCEDVSWKGYANDITLYVYVILLVRMWVEKDVSVNTVMMKMSSSLWGCELKKWLDDSCSLFPSVILLVRMWVEKLTGVHFQGEGHVILLVRMWVENWHTRWT